MDVLTDKDKTSTDSTSAEPESIIPTRTESLEAYCHLSVVARNHFYNEGTSTSFENAVIALSPPKDQDMCQAIRVITLENNISSASKVDIVAIMIVKLNTRTGKAYVQVHGDPTRDIYQNVVKFSLHIAEDFVKEVMDEKVEEPVPILLEGWIFDDDIVLSDGVKNKGFYNHRIYYRMQKDLPDSDSTTHDNDIDTNLPAGFEFRPYDADSHSHELHTCQQTAFRDHSGHAEDTPYETWLEDVSGPGQGYDPSMFHIVWNKSTNKIVGGALCYDRKYKVAGRGFLYMLFVAKEYRRLGIASALLKTCFKDFEKRGGYDHVVLLVDGDSLTNAVALYERVGMKKVTVVVNWRKLLRGDAKLVVE
ncbi:hypothetical protein HDU76_001188 [Blyttiomyces sp. JEL0837]|nr:hypothetical protein HDU76_001188 [Blyttiomyces sp. JEL0837]